MNLKMVSIIKILVLIFIILGSLFFTNIIIADKKEDIYNLTTNKQLHLFELVKINAKEKINAEYKNLLSNNLIEKLKKGEYNSIYGLSKIQLKKSETSVQPLYGFSFESKDLTYTGILPINTNEFTGSITFSLNIDEVLLPIQRKYDNKYLIILNNSVLNNNIDYNIRVKNYKDFSENSSLRNSNYKILSTNLIETNKIKNVLNKKHLELNGDFITIKPLFDMNSNQIGHLLIAENNTNANNNENIIKIVNDISNQSLITVMLIAAASGLILY